MSFGRRARRWSLAAFVLGALLGAGVLWPALSPEAPAPNPSSAARRAPEPRFANEPDALHAHGHEPSQLAADVHPEQRAPSREDLASFPAVRAPDLPDPAPGHADKVIPHPIDAARLRLTEQRRLFTQVKHAIRTADFAEARALLEAHDRDTEPEEAWSDLREGYQLIVDCKQFPSAETRARGQRFVDEQRGSTLRRSVRRACASP